MYYIADLDIKSITHVDLNQLVFYTFLIILILQTMNFLL